MNFPMRGGKYSALSCRTGFHLGAYEGCRGNPYVSGQRRLGQSGREKRIAHVLSSGSAGNSVCIFESIGDVAGSLCDVSCDGVFEGADEDVYFLSPSGTAASAYGCFGGSIVNVHLYAIVP